MAQGDQVRRTGRPPTPQHDVVDVLKGNARELADEIDRVQQILDREHLQFPRTLLLLDYLAQRSRRRAMSSS